MEPTPNISGYRLYSGVGSPANIDYSAPIAEAPPPAQPGSPVSVHIPSLPGGWPAGIWFIALRAIDSDGVEYADPTAIIRAEFNNTGNLLPPRPAAVSNLLVCPTSSQRLRISWRCRSDSASPWPEVFEVFLAPAEGTTLEQMLTGEPTAIVPAGSATSHSYSWTTGQLSPGRWRVVVRGVDAAGVAGPPRTAVASARPSTAALIDLLSVEVR